MSISVCYGAIFILLAIICSYLFADWLLVRFLRFNLPHKNKVSVGDTGSLFLGFMFYLFTMYFVTNQSVILSVFVPYNPHTLGCSLLFYCSHTDSVVCFLVVLGIETPLSQTTTMFTTWFCILPKIM